MQVIWGTDDVELSNTNYSQKTYSMSDSAYKVCVSVIHDVHKRQESNNKFTNNTNTSQNLKGLGLLNLVFKLQPPSFVVTVVTRIWDYGILWIGTSANKKH